MTIKTYATGDEIKAVHGIMITKLLLLIPDCISVNNNKIMISSGKYTDKRSAECEMVCAPYRIITSVEPCTNNLVHEFPERGYVLNRITGKLNAIELVLST